MEKRVTRKTASLIDTQKDMIPGKKVKSIIKPSQVPLTSYKGITRPKKAPLSFKFVKTQIMSGSQTKKKEKLPVLWRQFFSKKKITTAQIGFCNYRLPSRFDE